MDRKYQADLARHIAETQLQGQGNIGGGASPDNTACQERAREIPRNMQYLYEATEVLSMRIAALTQRLETVLISEPQSDNKIAAPCAATCLGSRLAEIFTRIDLMICAVARIDTLLEL